jgi:hypothetical protein
VAASPLLRLTLLALHVQPWWIYESLPTRMDSLMMGALLALSPLPSLRTARVVGGLAAGRCLREPFTDPAVLEFDCDGEPSLN